MLLKIIEITDKEGNSKVDFLNEIDFKHGLYGNFTFPLTKDIPFYFEYENDKSKTLRSSCVEDYHYDEDERLYIIITANSIYYIKEIDC